ncbi:hypothetical protein HMPREF0326_05694 [Desulfovibrio sp. 3_1_syn3]|uniref:hypothetical protein n=1 Tax=Desulfovibrio sp. 3_1_syn3 TaxID=457398 RepID=UPI00038F427B|nr:hypothetical protein [Desulfovibrio sp. 3_1_syn3]EQN50831.1 hypothetical protein HMPREF0326_05694 [Desulfovibrio sp. 3_1_syn3]
MEEIKELLEKQNNLLEFQNKILIEGFDALICMVWLASPKVSSTSLKDIIKDFRTAVGSM